MDKDMSILPENLWALFDMSRDPVIGIGPDQSIVYANPPAAALLGVGAGSPAGGTVPEHILNEPSERFVASARVGRKRLNVSVIRLDGLTVCVYTRPPEEPAGTGPSVRALQELSSCLMSARLAIDALVRRTGADADPALLQTSAILYREYYRMLRACRHMTLAAGVAADSLPYTPQATDLGQLCRELCDTVGRLTESLGISVTFQADFGVHLSMADRNLLEILLLNLLTNSLTHSRAGDTIRVELARQKDRFLLSVRDPGSGISPEQLTGVFNSCPDPAGPSAGAGLGLYIARGIAERHGGAMILESRPGRGTTVQISLPCKKSEDMVINSPQSVYRSEGMSTVLMELSPFLDRQYYNKKMFD